VRIHINLRSDHPNQFALLLLIIMSKGKYEWPTYADEENFLSPGVRRCDYVIGRIRDRNIHQGRIYK